MAVKSERLELRVAPEDRSRLERAAAVTGVSLSAFVLDAGMAQADALIAAADTTVVSAGYFDELLAALDRPDSAPTLRRAAARSRRSPRITR